MKTGNAAAKVMPLEFKNQKIDAALQSTGGQAFDPTASVVKPSFDSIPANMREITNWVVWRYEEADKPGGKLRKPPFDPKTGRMARSTDRRTWGTFEEAQAAYEQGGYAGVGIMMDPGLELVAHDFDDVVDPDTSAITSVEAQQLVEQMDTYTEVSPSGTGLRIFSIGHLPDGAWCNRRDAFGPGTGLEQYEAGQYVTLTGCRINSRDIEARQTAIDAVSFQYAPAIEVSGSTQAGKDVVHRGVVEAVIEERDTNPDAILTPDDQAILDKAIASRSGDKIRALMDGDTSGYPSASEADGALCLALAFWLGKDAGRIDRVYRNSGLYENAARSKAWDDDRRVGTYGTLTISTAISKCRDVLGETAQDKGKTQETPSYSPESSKPCLLSVSAIDAMEFSGTPPIDVFMDEGESAIFLGANGMGKSLAVLDMCLTLACPPEDGLLWGQFKIARPLKSLIIQSEVTAKGLRGRLRMMAPAGSAEAQAAAEYFRFASFGQSGRAVGSVTDPAFKDQLSRWLDEFHPDLLILDPLSTYHEEDENKSSDMRRALDQFTATCDRAGGLLHMVVHHVGEGVNSKEVFKGRGASGIGDWSANGVLLQQGPGGSLKMTHTKARNFPKRGVFYLERGSDLRVRPIPAPADAEKPNVRRVIKALQATGGRVDKQNDLVAALMNTSESAESTVKAWIKAAEKAGVIGFAKDGKVTSVFLKGVIEADSL